MKGEISMQKSAKYSLGVRLSIIQALLVMIILAIFTVTLTQYISKKLEQKSEHDLSQQVSLLVSSMSSLNSTLVDTSGKLASVFRTYFPGSFRLDSSQTVTIGDKETPSIFAGSTRLNLNTEIVDRFTSLTGAVGTVFVRSGDDFIRVSTSLKKEDGSRAIGTALDKNHPAYQGLLNGEPFVGKAVLFGKDYMTKYLPIKGDDGKVVAILFIGLDFTEVIKGMREKINKIKIGQTGYFFALDAKEGKKQGVLTIHPVKVGENLLGTKDSSGRDFVKEMITKKPESSVTTG